MNKSFKKYKNVKWIDTRLSKKHKVRQYVKHSQAAAILMGGAAQVRAICSSRANREMRGLAIARAVIDSYKSVGDVFLKHVNKDL